MPALLYSKAHMNMGLSSEQPEQVILLMLLGLERQHMTLWSLWSRDSRVRYSTDLGDAMIDASLAQKILQSEEGFMVAPPRRRKNHLLEMFHLFPEPPKWFKV